MRYALCACDRGGRPFFNSDEIFQIRSPAGNMVFEKVTYGRREINFYFMFFVSKLKINLKQIFCQIHSGVRCNGEARTDAIGARDGL